MHQPHQEHWDAATGQGIFLRSNTDLQLRIYCDSDLVIYPITCRSLTEYFIYLGRSPISWNSKKQHTVLGLRAKAKYRSMAITYCELK